MKVPMTDQVACVNREIAMRERAYPKWVTAGRMTQKKAEQEIRAMKAVQETLLELLEKERLL